MDNYKTLLNSFAITEEISEDQYTQLEDLTTGVRANTYISPGSYYIIDFYKMEFYHVFENHCFLCGYTPQEVRRMGFDFYLKCIPKNEAPMLFEITRAGFERFNQLPEQDKMEYSLYYNFHLKKESFKILVSQRIAPLKLCHGKLWLALCVMTPAACNETGRVFLRKHQGIPSAFFYSLKEKAWSEFTFITLSEIEKQVIFCGLKGMSLQETAEEICRGVDAVKKVRRNLLKKSGTKNFRSFCQLCLQHHLI